MSWTSRRAGRLVAALVLACTIGACSPSGAPASKGNRAWIAEQFLKLETSGDPVGETFKAIRETDTPLYNRMMDIFAVEISQGKSFEQAGEAARPLYLEKFTSKIALMDDPMIGEALAITIQQLKETSVIDPMSCVQLSRGKADPAIKKLSAGVQEREMHLMAQALRLTSTTAPMASAEEVSAWGKSFVEKHPELVEGMGLMQMPDPVPEQARKICEATRGMMEDINAHPAEERGRLFRGMQSLATAK